MVIASESHVEKNYKNLVTCKAHVTHGNYGRKPCGCKVRISRHMLPHGNYGRKPCGSKLQISRLTNSTCKAHEKPCDHTVITHESHVCTRGHVDNMCNNVVLDRRSPHESTRTPYNFVRRFLIG